jgi:2-polyprenyl-6-methoxyphenol hydroxylase-like FAD-dependent oxidoreductase
MPDERPRVLISGASVAGPVLAYWLHRFGFLPTVIERVAELRVGGGGHAVDLFGPVVELMDWMGVLPEVEQARTQTEVITLVRPRAPTVEVPAELLSEGVSERHIEIMRGDLAKILYEAARGRVEYIFDDSIAAVRDDGGQVEVKFENGGPRTFDLLVGADGLHSITRRLVFGPEESFLRDRTSDAGPSAPPRSAPAQAHCLRRKRCSHAVRGSTQRTVRTAEPLAKRGSASEDVPNDQHSADEAGADRNPLGGRLDLALGFRSESRMLWGDGSQPDREPDRRRYNDYHQDQQQRTCPPWGREAAGALGDA